MSYGASDRATRLHIDDVRTQIERALDPTVFESGTGTGTRTAFGEEPIDVTVDPEGCLDRLRGSREEMSKGQLRADR